jgi:hypothetical protein
LVIAKVINWLVKNHADESLVTPVAGKSGGLANCAIRKPKGQCGFDTSGKRR